MNKIISLFLGAILIAGSYKAFGSGQFSSNSYNPANVTITGGTGAFTAAPGGFSGLQVGTGAGANSGFVLGNLVSGTGAIWSTSVTQSTINYALNSNGTTTVLNATNNLNFSVNNTPIASLYTSGLNIATNNSTAGLNVTDTGAGGGANFKLTGNGATTPSKYIRSFGGNLEFVNSGYTVVMASFSDSGAFNAAGTITSPAGNFTSKYSLNGKLLAASGLPTPSACGTTPSINVGTANGSAAFILTIGSGGVATSCDVTFPTAANIGYLCYGSVASGGTYQANSVIIAMSASSTVTQIFNKSVSTGAALAFPASASYQIVCTAY